MIGRQISTTTLISGEHISTLIIASYVRSLESVNVLTIQPLGHGSLHQYVTATLHIVRHGVMVVTLGLCLGLITVYILASKY